MKAAASSWWTSMNLTRSCSRRRPSMIPLMPSPGRPKTVSTPQSASRETRACAASFAMCHLTVLPGRSASAICAALLDLRQNLVRVGPEEAVEASTDLSDVHLVEARIDVLRDRLDVLVHVRAFRRRRLADEVLCDKGARLLEPRGKRELLGQLSLEEL